jgi:hypothetical protein
MKSNEPIEMKLDQLLHDYFSREAENIIAPANLAETVMEQLRTPGVETVKLTSSNPIQVFISYSRHDDKLRKRFIKHLASLELQGVITTWHDHEIVPGDNWRRETDKHLNTAEVILLLVSENFLASRYAYGVEFKRAKERHERREARVIPVILRSCNWQDTPLGELQALPEGGKPVKDWKTIDTGFANVAEGLKKAIKELPSPATSITFTYPGFPDNFNLEDFKQVLREYFGVDLRKLTISVRAGSVKVVIDGDAEELARIVEALRDPAFRRKFARRTNPKSINYLQNGQEHTIPVESVGLMELLREAISAVPAVRYALGVAGIAATVSIVAGLSTDYRVAFFGTVIMLGLMFGLVSFSWFATNSPATIKPLALTLAWVFVLLISATAFFIFTSVFISWPQPLQAYLRPPPLPTPSPISTSVPRPIADPSHLPSVIPTPSPSPIPSPIPRANPSAIAIAITEVPPYDPVGGASSQGHIAGKVSGVNPETYSLVIYSKTNIWYVQPTTVNPKTEINSDGTWEANIQLGSRYLALVVPNDYNPPLTTSGRPTRIARGVAAIEVEGKR